jgi:hypothetical protein
MRTEPRELDALPEARLPLEETQLPEGHTRNHLSRTCSSPKGTLEAFGLLSTITRTFHGAFPVALVFLFPLVAFVSQGAGRLNRQVEFKAWLLGWFGQHSERIGVKQRSFYLGCRFLL